MIWRWPGYGSTVGGGGVAKNEQINSGKEMPWKTKLETEKEVVVG